MVGDPRYPPWVLLLLRVRTTAVPLLFAVSANALFSLAHARLLPGRRVHLNLAQAGLEFKPPRRSNTSGS